MKHPGTITFVGPDAPDRVVPVSEVPEQIAWHGESGAEKKPVVRVVATVTGNQRVIQSYGVDGSLLTTTYQMR